MKATGLLSEMDRYLFGQGTHYEIYKKLGSHPAKIGKKEGYYFAVWAPHAKSVSLVGNFNNWDVSKHRMTLIPECGIFEIFTTDIEAGEIYKYAIKSANDRIIYKADPYANAAEYRPGTASIVTDLSSIRWSDKKWMERRLKKSPADMPISIYEVHPGSWKRHRDEHGWWYYTYREMAAELVPYVKEMGYTHVELIGIPEHPLDASWGYEVTGYYAPTSRYGSPDDFAYLINQFHNNGIGVILDWVPSHFPKDAHGLADFDGEALYEYSDSLKGDNLEYDTKVFDYGKHQVSNFLIANALFWIEQFHIDGLRVSSVSSMIYFDYGKRQNYHATNIYGGTENLEALEFLKHLNSMMAQRNPNILMIAEEHTNRKDLTLPLNHNGLGFTFSWDITWNKNFIDYLKYDPYFRQFNHAGITSTLTLSTSANRVLPISHDDVSHEKTSMYEKIQGTKADKIATLKTAYAYMLGYPGKKLLFMGQDFGQDSTWTEERQLDWYLQYDSQHSKLQRFVRDLLQLYKKYSCLYTDNRPLSGFNWVNCTDSSRSILSFIRTAPKSGANLLFVINFTPESYPEYAVGVPKKGRYTLLLNQEQGLVSGSEAVVLTASAELCDALPFRIKFALPAYGIAIFKF